MSTNAYEVTSSISYASTLLKNDRDIRTVRILGRQDGTIACKLRVVDLKDQPTYLAISYTWGPATTAEAARGVDGTPVRAILCDGHRYLVTQNLYAFLSRVVEDPALTSKDMWIDSMCINQRDDLERTAQVKLMADIYNGAESVLSWLGEGDEDSKKSFALMEALTKITKAGLNEVTPRHVQRGAKLELPSPYTEIGYWDSLKQFFQRTYFTRIWVIQEIALGRKRLAMCGGDKIDWLVIAEVSKFLTLSPWKRWIDPQVHEDEMEAGTTHYSTPNLVEAIVRSRGDPQLKGLKLLLYSLVRSRRFRATDQRDKVYGVLGIAGDPAKDRPGLQPIYGTRSVRQTYISAAIEILRSCDDLLLLAHAEGDTARDPDLSLPSWVPDWSCPYPVGLGVLGYTRYEAAGSEFETPTIHEDNLSLTIRGIKVDVITHIGERKMALLKGKEFPMLRDLLSHFPKTYAYSKDQSPYEVLWRTLITDTGSVARVHPCPLDFGSAFEERFGRDLFQKQKLDEGKTPEPWEPISAFRAQRTPKAPSFVAEPAAASTDGREADDIDAYMTIFSHAPHLRPFLTDLKYFGVGSESLAVDDSIWIIKGSRVPLILRPAMVSGEPEAFRIVGGAYVHGIMKGQILESNADFSVITIV